MTRTITLHAGFHKTGTTSFQAWVTANRDKWPRDFRFIGKDTSPEQRALHDAIIAWCKDPKDIDRYTAVQSRAYWLAVSIANTDAKRFIVSMESLLGDMPGRNSEETAYPLAKTLLEIVMGELKRYARADEISVALSLRPKDKWVQSIYSHEVLHGRTDMTLTQFARRPCFQYGPDAIFLRLLEAGRSYFSLHFGATPEQWLNIMGVNHLETDKWRPAAHLNRGLSASAIKMLQRIPSFARRPVAKAMHAWRFG